MYYGSRPAEIAAAKGRVKPLNPPALFTHCFGQRAARSCERCDRPIVNVLDSVSLTY